MNRNTIKQEGRSNQLTRLVSLYKVIIFMSILLAVQSCRKDDPGTNDPELDKEIAALNLKPLPDIVHPADNPASKAKIKLGKMLFWDPIISGEKDVACATCHHPKHGYTDGLDLAIGVNGSGLGPNRTENSGNLDLNELIERVGRNSPSILNAAYNGLTASDNCLPEDAPMFWDSRAKSLEKQCQGPPTSRSEMRGDAYHESLTFDSIVARLAAIPEYVNLFDDAFGGGNAVSRAHFAKAIAAFERTIVAGKSPYDKYVQGEKGALTVQQKEGLLLFFGKGECDKCHSGPMFSDFDFHALGVPDHPSHPAGTDPGKDSLYRFRTPTLRNATLTAPYMHNGMVTTLQEAVSFQNNGVSKNPHVTTAMLDADVKPLDLTEEEIDKIVSFLESLTDNDFDKAAPPAVPSKLKVGGNID